MPRGAFIVIDGTDGSGKATQTALLVEKMRVEGIAVESISFPQYGKKSAGPVEEYLAGVYGTGNEVTSEQASILFAVDRFAAKRKIEELLASGTNVVADRYVSANMGHQGGKIPTQETARRTQFLEWADKLEYETFGIPRPTLTVILHVPVNITQHLMAARGREADILEKDVEHLRAAEATYLEISTMFSGMTLIECAPGGTLLSKEEIHELLWQQVVPILHHATSVTHSMVR